MGSEGVGEDRGREGSWGGKPRDAVTGRRIVSAASALESGFSRRTQWVDEPGSYAALEHVEVEAEDGSVLGSIVEHEEERDEEEPLLPSHAEGRSFWPLSPVGKNVLKCVVAYFLAELFTFVPALAEGIGAPFEVDGPVRNAHVIATVAVYFNPAKTIGAMIEADLFMLVGAAYSVFLCCGSMAMTVFLDGYGLERLAHVLVLVVWLGCGFAVLAYIKVKVNKPTLTTACSMVSLIASVIITKEGAFHIGHFRSQAILQIIIIVLIGTAISNVVCFSLWASSATTKLQGDLNKTLDSFSTLLGMLTKTFLLEDDITTPPSLLKSAIDAHQSSFTTLQSSLAQAKYEFLDSRIRNTSQAYDEAVKSMTRLAQGLTGMRSGCTLQYDLMRAALEGEEERGDERIVLDKFKERVGESLRQLSRTSQRTLALLRSSFSHPTTPANDLETSPLSSESLLSLKHELEQSLTLFKRAHSRAIKILYRRLPAKTMYEGKDPFADPEAFRKAVGEDEGPNDNLFRIYYYCFNFEEWVKELACLVETFVQIRSTEEEVEILMGERRRSWGVFARLMRGWGGRTRGRKRRTIAQRVAGAKEIFTGLTKRSKPQNPFPKIVDGALTSHQIPAAELSFLGQVKYAFWRLGWHMWQPNLRFAIKTGVGVAVLASAAFIPSTRPLWLEWRGEWALISYMVIMAPTLGGTNFLALGRILGTFFGAGAAVTIWTVFPEDPVMLPIMGALFSVPCFYITVTRPQYGPSSRFVLLTFNLTCLYAFNLREIDTHVLSIAFHRSLAVAFGVAWGLVVTSYIWPFEARRELRKGLSEFFLNSAHLYETLVRAYSTPPPALSQMHTRNPSSADRETLTERSPLLFTAEAQKHLSDVAGDFVEMEVYLQLSLIKLSGLLDSTKHEPRLKGPFPISTYRAVLTSCQSILDLLTSMRTVTTREAWYTTVRRDFVIPVNRERREMVGNVLLYLSLLASALSLKTPLPAYLPPAAEARDRLVTKLRSLPIVKKRIVRGGSEGLLYLAYALTMKDVIAQLDSLGKTFQLLFGVIGGANSKEEFEALFITNEEEDSQEETDSERSDSSTDTEDERRTQ